MRVMMNDNGAALPPLERRIRRLTDWGVPTAEIAARFQRAPDTIDRIREMSELRQGDDDGTQGTVLNPLERRILRWRSSGADHEAIGEMFGRSADFVRRVEELADLKLRGEGG